jgi:predicted small secreted protein
MRGDRPIIAILSLAALLLVGCQTRPGYTQRDVSPLYDDFGHARSLTLTTPVVRTAQRPDIYEPWYNGRRDISPFVTAGSISQQYEESVTTTRDSQHIYGDRVYDRYNETTYRRTYRSGTR